MSQPKYLKREIIGRETDETPHTILVDEEGKLIVKKSYLYSHVTGDTLVKNSSGTLHSLTVNACTVGGTLTIYDSLNEAGTLIAIIIIPINPNPFTLIYDVTFNTGLYLGFDGVLVADITVSYD